MKRTILILAMSAALGGCASFQQAVAAYGALAVEGAKMSNDNLIAGWKVLACATPISAAARNPEIIPALKLLCFNPAADVPPSALLDSIEQHKKP